jgi:hypothetical protein
LSNINVKVSTSTGIAIRTKKDPSVLVNQGNIANSRLLNDLDDVDTSAKEDGSVLVYNLQTEKFVASRLLERQFINGGNF